MRDGLTTALVERALRIRHDELPADVLRVARDCLVDWLACTIAARDEPASRIVLEAVLEEGGRPQATLIGRDARASCVQAALVNGTASHALDYDDVNLAVPGHMTVAIVPALLALAEQRGARSDAFLTAFVAGYETACRIGKLVEPAHYANGFHATATIGCLGAAVACARLIELPPEQAAHAVGLAATQAAGLKLMFGTMAKPLHAGLAAQAGLRSVLLAERGLTSRLDAIEAPQGFARVHGADFRVDLALADPPGGFHLLANLFKFHAACYSTHAAIEAVAALRREHGLRPEAVEHIRVTAGEGCSICNIAAPATDLEAKFSLRAAAAFALLGIDTGSLLTWGRCKDADVISVRDRVSVELVPGLGLSDAEVSIRLRDGREFGRFHDCGIPPADKERQSERVFAKFRSLVTSVAGEQRAASLAAVMHSFGEGQDDLSRMIEACPRLP